LAKKKIGDKVENLAEKGDGWHSRDAWPRREMDGQVDNLAKKGDGWLSG
jgi:hypothetical protein